MEHDLYEVLTTLRDVLCDFDRRIKYLESASQHSSGDDEESKILSLAGEIAQKIVDHGLMDVHILSIAETETERQLDDIDYTDKVRDAFGDLTFSVTLD